MFGLDADKPQLELFGSGDQAGRSIRLVSDDGEEELCLKLLDHGASLRCVEHGELMLQASIRMQGGLLVDIRVPAAYGMSSAMPVPTQDKQGPGQLVAAMLETALARRSHALLHLPAASAALALLAGHLQTREDKKAWALARRFHVATRWSLYRLLSADASGRLAQLVDTCPGVLTLLAKLGQAHVPATDRLVKAAVEGMALRKLVDEVVRVYCASCAIPDESQGRVLQTCRLLVMRAGPLVPAGHILPNSRGFLVDDIPRKDPRANLAWYHAMSALALTGGPREAPLREARVQLARYTSRHLTELHRIANEIYHRLEDGCDLPGGGGIGELRLLDDKTRIGELLERFLYYLQDTKHWPALSTPPDRLVSRAIRWERAVLREWAGEDPVGPCGAGRLPCMPCPPHGLHIEEVTTFERLLEESTTMEHCVFSRVARAGGLEGNVLIHATWQQHRATALLCLDDETWAFEEVNGPRNALVPAGFMEALECWLSRVNGNEACI